MKGGESLAVKFQARKFMFDNVSSDKFNLVICSFDGSSVVKSNEVADVNITTEKVAGSDKWLKTKSDYSSPLSFTFSICKKDYSAFLPIERRIISGWLQSAHGGYKPMQFFSQDYANVVFYSKCVTIEKVIIDSEIFGYNLTFQTNAPYGYTTEQTFGITSTSNGITLNITNTSDEFDVILYPRVEINVLANCEISIKNNNTKRTTRIKNCVAGERIIMDAELGIIESSVRDGSTIITDFNKIWFGLTNTIFEIKNSITFTGDAQIKIICAYPRKVGV